MTTYTRDRIGEAERKTPEEPDTWTSYGIAADLPGYTEHQLREAIAEARKRLGKEYTREIIEAELS